MITITDNAKQKIQSLLTEQNKKYFQIGIDSGGCSGFRYTFDLVDEVEEDFSFIELYNSLSIIVDNMSAEMLSGATLDFVKETFTSYFKWDNPNANSKCGCGTSFS